MVRQNNIKNEFHLPLTTKPSSGCTYKSQDLPLHMVSKAASTIQGPDIHDIKSYISTLRMMKPTLSYPVNRLYPPSAMMGSIVHQPYKKYGYQSPPHILIRTAAPPSHILHNLAAHRYSPYSYMHHSLTGKNPYVSNI